VISIDNGKPRMFCAGAKVGRDYFCVLVPLRNDTRKGNISK